MSALHGKFVWVELMTTDLDAAENFYQAVMGWQIRDSGMPGWRYTIGSVGTAGVAGLMSLTAEMLDHGAKPCWLSYIWADDVDAAAAKVTESGGGMHRAPADIPGVGRFAVVADPQGAVFVLFKGTTETAEQPAFSAPGAVGWHELYAAEWEAAFAFYAALFGWQKAEAVDMGPMGTYQLFGDGAMAAGGMMTKPSVVPVPVWNSYFNADEIDAAAARVKAQGGQVINGPHQVPGGTWIIHCLDAQGAFFGMSGPRAAA